MNTEMADLRKIGEETYFNETTKDYTVYVAYEIKKNAMFRFMKKQARTDAKIERTGRRCSTRSWTRRSRRPRRPVSNTT
jgi:hypothetical protein